MVAQKRYMLFFGILICVGAGIYAKRDLIHHWCASAKHCQKNQHCQCYCSEKGDYREKTADDNPVYVKGNEYVKDGVAVHCFCKQWDLDNFPGPVARDQGK